jgi:bacteriocin-like protein
MRITVSDIYPLGSEQIFNDLSIEELKEITGGYRSQRGNYRSTETPLPLSIEAQFQDWRTELNTIMDNLRQRLDT